jgi:hypothetical protein
MRKNESRYRKLNLEDSAVFSLNSVLIVLVFAELKPLTWRWLKYDSVGWWKESQENSRTLAIAFPNSSLGLGIYKELKSLSESKLLTRKELQAASVLNDDLDYSSAFQVKRNSRRKERRALLNIKFSGVVFPSAIFSFEKENLRSCWNPKLHRLYEDNPPFDHITSILIQFTSLPHNFYVTDSKERSTTREATIC